MTKIVKLVIPNLDTFLAFMLYKGINHHWKQEMAASWTDFLLSWCSCTQRLHPCQSVRVSPVQLSPRSHNGSVSRRMWVCVWPHGVALCPVALCSRHVKMNGTLSLGPLFRGPRSAWGKCQSLTAEAGWKMSSFTDKSCEKGNVSAVRSLSTLPLRSLFFSRSLSLSNSLCLTLQLGTGGRENYSANFWKSGREVACGKRDEERWRRGGEGDGIRQGVNQTGFCQMRAYPLPLQQQCMTWAVYFTP